MRKTKFAIDFFNDQTFEGYTQGENWNGFACPYFTFEQVQELLNAWQAKGWDASYDAEKDRFTFEVNTSTAEQECDSFSAIEFRGTKLYPVGAFCWIWEEAENGNL